MLALIAVSGSTLVCAQGNLPQPVQMAVADLAGRLNVNAAAIDVASFEEVTWPDTSLGNPQPGQMYAQVLTPGYRVYLHAEGRRYEYHTDRGTRVTLVGAAEAAPGPHPAQGEEQETLTRLALVTQARRDLAERLGIEPGEVYLAALEERTWRSAALGVEEPGEVYAEVMTPGYRMILEAREVLYDYHTDLTDRVKPAGLVEPGGDGAGGAERPEALDAAIADLAARLNVEAGEIAVVDVAEVQWPSGSLGLPEPGMMYTMMIVSGHRIILRAKGREFEYRSSQGAARYAGVVYPDDAEVSLLAMTQTEPADGNNFFHLQRIDPDTEQRETVVEFVSDFATTPDGRDIVVKRRISRSGHLLAHVAVDGTTTELARAFDFHGTALRPDGQMVAYWLRPSVADRAARLNIRAWPWDQGTPIEPDLSGLPAEFTPGELVWTDDGLAFTVRGATGARSFYWTPDGSIQGLGSFAVLDWIPRTRALLIRRAQNNREILASFIPGMGETAVLADVASLQSVDAPVGEEWVIAAVSEGGAPDIRRITWGGATSSVTALRGTDTAGVRISPVGQVVVAEYRQGDASRVDVWRLGDSPLATRTLSDAAGAVPVAR